MQALGAGFRGLAGIGCRPCVATRTEAGDLRRRPLCGSMNTAATRLRLGTKGVYPPMREVALEVNAERRIKDSGSLADPSA
ncbi:hypothetical protein JOD66_003581 [Nocardioides nitrophenolicus]|nr:hypothetical protein [Nocardioides nitrophenolicus]